MTGSWFRHYEHALDELESEPRRMFATSRLFTGKAVTRGYIYDRMTGRPTWACPHEHRKAWRAQHCAEGELARHNAEEAARRADQAMQDETAARADAGRDK